MGPGKAGVSSCDRGQSLLDMLVQRWIQCMLQECRSAARDTARTPSMLELCKRAWATAVEDGF